MLYNELTHNTIPTTYEGLYPSTLDGLADFDLSATAQSLRHPAVPLAVGAILGAILGGKHKRFEYGLIGALALGGTALIMAQYQNFDIFNVKPLFGDTGNTYFGQPGADKSVILRNVVDNPWQQPAAQTEWMTTE